MFEASRYYYKAQLIGWSVYILIATVFLIAGENQISFKIIGGIYLVFLLGLVISHLYRALIIKSGWLDKDIFSLVPRVAGACIGIALIFQICYILIGNLVFGWNLKLKLNDPNTLTWGMLFFIWSLIYFSYNFFQRFRQESIKNLRLEAAKNEYELRRLKDQMNPHFIFNAMNTIRALIDEDPKKAKVAVTQLSNVLRSSLQTGKHDLIPLTKELEIVRDYLAIEKVRYEERLQVHYHIEDKAKNILIPPLMLQTIVENCIKHGISKLPNGGEIILSTKIEAEFCDLEVLNTGQFTPNSETESSLGLENTRNRLALSFGRDAWLTIGNADQSHVKTSIHLPLKTKS
jgi:two-component system LytT family sensor kinase